MQRLTWLRPVLLAVSLVLCSLAQSQPGAVLLNSLPATLRPDGAENLNLLAQFAWTEAQLGFANLGARAPDTILPAVGEALAWLRPGDTGGDARAAQTVLQRLNADPAAPRRDQNAVEHTLLLALTTLTATVNPEPAAWQAHARTVAALADAHPGDAQLQSLAILSALAAARESPAADAGVWQAAAAALALPLYRAHPDAAGIAHLTAMALATPESAQEAQPIIDALRQQPATRGHTQHAAAHIAMALGDWDGAADASERAYYAAVTQWREGDPLAPQWHAVEWGHYADLQREDYARLRTWETRAVETAALNPMDPEAAAVASRLQARHLIAREFLPPGLLSAAQPTWMILALGWSAVSHLDFKSAQAAATLLADRASQPPFDPQLPVMSDLLTARVLQTSGATAAAIRLLTRSAAREARQPPPPFPVPQPIQEALGELRLRQGDPSGAARAFTEALQEAPFRPRSLLGLARSHVAAGEPFRANPYYAYLLDVWDDRHLLGVSEARTHLSIYGEPQRPNGLAVPILIPATEPTTRAQETHP